MEAGRRLCPRAGLRLFSAAMVIRFSDNPPPDAAGGAPLSPHVAYAVDRLPAYDSAFYDDARAWHGEDRRDDRAAARGRAFDVPAGHFFRIVSIEGPQVGDLNLWNAANLARALLQRQDTRAQRDAS